MSYESGYYKAHRSLGSHWLWEDKPYAYGQAWMDLVMNAAWKDHVVLIKQQKVLVKRGQAPMSRGLMKARWGWSLGKVDRFLKHLSDDGMIVQQAGHLTTLVTICNYEKYQGEDMPDRTAGRTPDGIADGTSDGTHQKKVKKDKNLKEEILPCAFDLFWNVWPRKINKQKAKKAWSRLTLDDQQIAIADVTARAMQDEQWIRDGGQFIPHPTTYLNGRRWEDQWSTAEAPPDDNPTGWSQQPMGSTNAQRSDDQRTIFDVEGAVPECLEGRRGHPARLVGSTGGIFGGGFGSGSGDVS